jgi:hypothetical protein
MLGCFSHDDVTQLENADWQVAQDWTSATKVIRGIFLDIKVVNAKLQIGFDYVGDPLPEFWQMKDALEFTDS